MPQGKFEVAEMPLAMFYDDRSSHYFRDAIMRVAA